MKLELNNPDLQVHIVHKRTDLSVEDALAITHGLAVTGFMFEIDVSAQGCVPRIISTRRLHAVLSVNG